MLLGVCYFEPLDEGAGACTIVFDLGRKILVLSPDPFDPLADVAPPCLDRFKGRSSSAALPLRLRLSFSSCPGGPSSACTGDPYLNFQSNLENSQFFSHNW